MENNNKPPRLKSAPRVRQFFWCDFPKKEYKSEFSKSRPVIILSKNAKLHGNVTILPLTTKSQPSDSMAYSLGQFINKKSTWVICNYITTLSVHRLSPPKGAIPRVPQEDFNEILELVRQTIPKPL